MSLYFLSELHRWALLAAYPKLFLFYLFLFAIVLGTQVAAFAFLLAGRRDDKTSDAGFFLIPLFLFIAFGYCAIGVIAKDHAPEFFAQFVQIQSTSDTLENFVLSGLNIHGWLQIFLFAVLKAAGAQSSASMPARSTRPGLREGALIFFGLALACGVAWWILVPSANAEPYVVLASLGLGFAWSVLRDERD